MEHEFSNMYCLSCGYEANHIDESCYNCGASSLEFFCGECGESFESLSDEYGLCLGREEYMAAEMIFRFINLRIMKKRIIAYSNYILDDYFNPDSPYVRYVLETCGQPRSNGIAFINASGDLKILSSSI